MKTRIDLPANLTADELSQLALNQSSLVRQAVATHSKTTKASLLELARDENGYVREAVAAHSRTPPESLTLLADDLMLPVRLNVAKNPGTPPDVLDTLADDQAHDVRHAVARNPSTRANTLILLFKRGKSVQTFLSRKENPRELLLAIAASADENGLIELGIDRRTPGDVIASFVDRLGPLGIKTIFGVRKDLASVFGITITPSGTAPEYTPATIRDMFAQNKLSTLARLAQGRHKFTPDAFATIVECGWKDVQLMAEIARNGHVPGEQLTRLAEHESVTVRHAVAKNEATPRPTLVKLLLHDTKSRVRDAAQMTVSTRASSASA